MVGPALLALLLRAVSRVINQLPNRISITGHTEATNDADPTALYEQVYLDPARPGVEDLVDQIVAGVRSSCTYAGARTVDELHERGRFVRITSAGLKESHPHDVQMVMEAPNYTAR